MASYRTRGAVGGLLSGLGTGLANRAEARRQEGLILAQALRDQQAAEADRSFRREENERDRQLRRDEARESQGLLHATTTDENRNLIGITRGKEAVDLGVRVAPTSRSGDESGMSAGDRREIQTAIEAATTTDDLGNESVDRSKVRQTLLARGRPDLAQFYADADGSGAPDRNSDDWLQAEEMARQWIADETTILGRDKNELAQYGGNRTEARLAKTQEFYDQLTGQRAPAGGRQVDTAPSAAGPAEGRTSTEYQTPDQVRDAFRAGDLSREEAVRILRDRFQMQ